jgi:hypothetical protein
MTCLSLPEIRCCGKRSASLFGALAPSPGHGDGCRALFFCDHRVAGLTADMPPGLWVSPGFPPRRPRDGRRERPLW